MLAVVAWAQKVVEVPRTRAVARPEARARGRERAHGAGPEAGRAGHQEERCCCEGHAHRVQPKGWRSRGDAGEEMAHHRVEGVSGGMGDAQEGSYRLELPAVSGKDVAGNGSPVDGKGCDEKGAVCEDLRGGRDRLPLAVQQPEQSRQQSQAHANMGGVVGPEEVDQQGEQRTGRGGPEQAEPENRPQNQGKNPGLHDDPLRQRDPGPLQPQAGQEEAEEDATQGVLDQNPTG